MSAFAVVADFEQAIAKYAGSRFAVAVDCCTNALFLCMKYLNVSHVVLPAKTYCSVPMAALHAGASVKFEDRHWQGVYRLAPHDIFDGAKRFRRGMYEGGYHCLSFHAKKHIPIGRGGMILLDDLRAYQWLRRARYDGRDGKPYPQERIEQLGWHVYMTPEQAARGLLLFQTRAQDSFPDLTEDYPDLREMPIFQKEPALA